MTRVDLHVHSNASDGRLAPAAVMEAARAGGLDVIALADHDTTAGVAEAGAAAAAAGLRLIPAIEISTRHEGAELHILGYHVNPEAASLRAHEAAAHARREQRMRDMVARLQSLGLSIEFEDVVRAAGPEAASLGRPHLARALLANGQTRYYGEAFDLYLRDGGAGFVAAAFPSVAEAVRTIGEAGGAAVWAHPPLELARTLLPTFREMGMQGVECFRPTTPAEDARELLGLARANGMFPTGGSDWHGPYRSALGDFYVPADEVAELLAAAPP